MAGDVSKKIMAAEVGNQARRRYQLLEGKLLEMEASALVVSDADVFRTRQVEGRWSKGSAWIGCGTLMEECEIRACEQERWDQEAAVGSTRADNMGHEAQVFTTKRCQSWPGCGSKEEAKRLVSWRCTDLRPRRSF